MDLKPYENYEFMARIRLPLGLPDSAQQSDNGLVKKFTTLTETKPLVVTKEDATNVRLSEATVHGELISVSWENAEVWFQWRSSGGNWENTDKKVLTKPDNFSENLTNLRSDTTYEFKSVASNPAGENFGSVKNFTTPQENAEVTTKDATDVKRGNATLNASISFGDFDNVDVIITYRKEGGGWENKGWMNDYTSENYSLKLSSLPTGKIFEFKAMIRFGPDNIFDNGSILTFNTGGVKIRTSHTPDVRVNNQENVEIEVQNEYQNKELRDVVVEAEKGRFSDTLITIGTISSNSTESETFSYVPINSGEKRLEFSIKYRVYEDDNFLYFEKRSISTTILVTGTEYENAIALRVSDEYPPLEWIFNGETYTAQIEVHNQRPASVSGIRVINDKGRDYGVGTLQADESTTVQIRVSPENYKAGTTNEVVLRATHELGVSPPLTLKFGVRSKKSPVGIYLVRTNSPIFEGQKLKFELVIAGSMDSEAQDLVIRSLSDNVIPEGYWVGEEMKNLPKKEVTKMEGFELLKQLYPLPSGAEAEEEEEEKERAIIGRTLYFEARGLKRGDNSLRFQIIYELGDRVVTREFNVDFEIQGTPEIILIQSEPVIAVKGSIATISLEVANKMPSRVEAVAVHPPENVEIFSKPVYWVGPMDPDEFLPVEFKLKTRNLKDGDNLSFYPAYRVGEKEVKGSPITVTINLVESKEAPIKYYAIASAIVVLLLLFLIYRYRR